MELEVPLDGVRQSLRHFLDKIKQWHLHSPLAQKKFNLRAVVEKCQFSNFSDRAGTAVPLVMPSGIPFWVSKKIFLL